ncbi:unnamed protein product [Commensalibacter communis]|uniref:Knr4/Smi1-like domain-containing protein n=1 Tax=Commensalibacter communis TaxID=2972786 RepID=A0A9W4TMV4_9PROT|nr:SMI1/KNR4 family protein [Commensalibacter communis]CAI3937836.1 unnamed protein product [Commensalibacter communis]CAI3942499.1 unnamed protein product [Commensalibacter communis]CAI3944172.1 unnamed protein product [Commensalibacter communis]CAI3945598.1 unnamed protein product [Commensalibacter communis]
MFQSKYKVCRIVDKKIQKLEKDFGMFLENSYKNFLKKYNVVECHQEFAFPVKENLIAGEDDISIDIILGFCKDEQEDIYSVNYDYQDRIPEDVMAIALVNESDWLCLHTNGKIHYWDHEVHDLYLDMKQPNTYLSQNVDLPFIANSFQELLEGIVHKERVK